MFRFFLCSILWERCVHLQIYMFRLLSAHYFAFVSYLATAQKLHWKNGAVQFRLLWFSGLSSPQRILMSGWPTNCFQDMDAFRRGRDLRLWSSSDFSRLHRESPTYWLLFAHPVKRQQTSKAVVYRTECNSSNNMYNYHFYCIVSWTYNADVEGDILLRLWLI